MTYRPAHGLWLLAGLALVLTACASRPAREGEKHHGPVGTLIGEVRLATGVSLPQFTSLDLVRRPLHPSTHDPLPRECQAANEAARTPVHADSRGMLSGVAVAASDFTRIRDWKPKKHKVVLEHCQLQPALLAATGGDTLEVENRDDYGFEPLVGPAYRARPLARGEPYKVPLVPGGVDALQCSLGAPCGRTDLLVFFHPVHAVTDQYGRFSIPNFPASELVRVTAWHPLFEPSESFVWVDPGQVSTLNLTLTPKTRFAPASESTAAASGK